MTEENTNNDVDEQEDDETVLTRRDAVKGSAALGTAALASQAGLVGSAAAQTGTEPRIQLGDDWEIDDEDDGSGNTDLRLHHIPSGAEFKYDVSAGEWTLGTLNASTVDATTGNVTNVNSTSVTTQEADVTNETFIVGSRDSTTASTSSGTWVNVINGESKDNRDEFNSSQQFVPDETAWYYVVALTDVRGSASAGDELRCRVQDITNGTDIETAHQSASSPPAIHQFVFLEQLTAGDTYEIQGTNMDSSFRMHAGNSQLRIVRGLVT